MNAREYLEAIVRPNINDFSGDYANLRLGLNAVHTLDALAAHIFNEAGGEAVLGCADDSAYRGVLAAANGDFGLLRDVAKAVKHVELNRGKPQLSGAKQVSVQTLGYGQARYGEGRYGSPSQLVVRTDGGDTRVLETIVMSSLAFLEGEMAHHDL